MNLNNPNNNPATEEITIEAKIDPKDQLKNEVTNLISGMEPLKKSATDILRGLLKNIGPIDFEVLAFPEVNTLREEKEELLNLISTGDLSKTEIDKHKTQYDDIVKELNKYKLTKNHYLVLCIEQLLKIAQDHNWGLCKNNGAIFIYNGGYWSEIDKEQFQNFLGKVALKMGVEKFKSKIHTFREELFKQFMSDSFLPNLVTHKNKVLINLENGTLEISPSQRVLRAFNQNDFLTYQLPFEYDVNTGAPLFQKYLDEVLPDKDKQKVLAEYCAYLFIKSGVLKLEKMLILYGSGANGKSVFFEVLNALLGRENMSNFSLQNLTNENGYYRAKIGNKLANYASEITGKMQTDIFKQMASGEPIEARLPYGDPFILTEYAKLIFNCNALPKDIEQTNAFFRRFLIIDFNVTIPEDKQDRELPQKIIQGELSGVLNWVLDGLDRLLEQKNFSKCEAVENARHNYESESDSVQVFLLENQYQRSSIETISISELYSIYKVFCIEDCYRPVSKTNFIKRLIKLKILVERKNTGRVAYISKQ